MGNPFRIYENSKECGEHGIEFMYYFTKIKNLFINRFRWIGLPDYIPPWFLEQTLFYRANAIFAHDKSVDMYGIFRGNLTGMPDIYNVPDIREVYATPGYLEEYDKEHSVIIWDNPSKLPFYYEAYMYARALANAWETREMNMFVQRTPFVIKSPEQMKLTYDIIGQQYQLKVPVIKINDSVDIKNLDVLNLDAPYLVTNITEYMNMVWSQLLTDLGYESNPINKKERLISQEVMGNNGETEAQRNVGLDLRIRACDAINKIFGLNVSVEFNSSLKTSLNGFDVMDERGEANE